MLDIGIIGLASFYGPDYARRIDQRADARVSGGMAIRSDDDLERLGRPPRAAFGDTFSCPMFDNRSALLDQADAVIVASPTVRRGEDAVAALESGRPVLTAKPAAISAKDADLIARASSESVPALTTCPARFDDAMASLHHRVMDGEIGSVHAIRGAIRHDRVPRQGIEANAEHAPSEAGAALAMGYYTADMLGWFGDATPVSISGSLQNVNTPYYTHPDLGAAIVEHDDGSIGTMSMTYAADCREKLGNWEIEVVGTDGIGRTVHHGYEGVVWTDNGGTGRSPITFGRTPSPILDRQLAAFVDTIETGSYGRLVPSPKEVSQALHLCEAWIEASDTNSVWPIEGDVLTPSDGS